MNKINEIDNAPQTISKEGNVTLIDTEKATEPLFWAPSSDLQADLDEIRADEITNDLCDRWTQIGNVDFSSTKAFGAKLGSCDIPTCFTSTEYGESHISNLIKSYQYIRGDVTLRFEINANRFQIGKVLVAFYYDSLNDSDMDIREDVYVASSMNHTLIDVGVSNPCEIEIPYIYPTSYCRTRSNTYYNNANFAKAYIYVLNPLKVSENTSNSCSISIFGKMKNIRVNGMIPRNKTLTLYAEPEMMSILKSALIGAAEGAFGAFRDNRDYPRNPESSQKVVPLQCNTWCVGTNTTLQNNILRLDNLGCDPLLSTNEMNISNITKRCGLIKQLSWTSSDVAGTTLGKFPVHPIIEGIKRKTSSTNKLALYYYPPVSAMASLFSYWRGSLKLSFDITASSFHNGRISVAFYPSVKGEKLPVSERGGLHQIIFDLKDNTQFEYNIPFNYDFEYAPISYVDSGKEVQNNPIGCVYVTVVNKLITVEGVSDTVTINLFLSGNDDFELAVPVHTHLSPGRDRNFLIDRDVVKVRDGYNPVYVGLWRYWDGPILRYGAISDQVAQFTGCKYDVVYGIASYIVTSDGKHVSYFVCPRIQGDYARYLIPFTTLEKAKSFLLSGTLEHFLSGNKNVTKDVSNLAFTIQYTYVKPEMDIPHNIERIGGNSNKIFGESYTDIKDLLRRYTSYYEDSFVVSPSTSYNDTVYTIPLTYAGLVQRYDAHEYSSISNYGRSGAIELLSSAFRYFAGGMRIRIVIDSDDTSLIFCITHIPDTNLVAYRGLNGAFLGRKDSYIGGYAMCIQSIGINQVVDLEVPNYNPTQISCLQRTKLEVPSNTTQLYGLGNLTISTVCRVARSVKVSIHVFNAMADDTHFRTFCGFPLLCNARDVPEPKIKNKLGRSLRVLKIDKTHGAVNLHGNEYIVDIDGNEVTMGNKKISKDIDISNDGISLVPTRDDILYKFGSVMKALQERQKINLKQLDPSVETIEHEMDSQIVNGVQNMTAIARGRGLYKDPKNSFENRKPRRTSSLPRNTVLKSGNNYSYGNYKPVELQGFKKNGPSYNLGSAAVAVGAAIGGATIAAGTLAALPVPGVLLPATGLALAAGGFLAVGSVATGAAQKWREQIPLVVEDAREFTSGLRKVIPKLDTLLDGGSKIVDRINNFVPSNHIAAHAPWLIKLYTVVKDVMAFIGKHFTVGFNATYCIYKKYAVCIMQIIRGVFSFMSEALGAIIQAINPSSDTKPIKDTFHGFWISIEAFVAQSLMVPKYDNDLRRATPEDLENMRSAVDSGFEPGKNLRETFHRFKQWEGRAEKQDIYPESSCEAKDKGVSDELLGTVAVSFSVFFGTLANVLRCKNGIKTPWGALRDLLTKIPNIAKDSMSILSFVNLNLEMLRRCVSTCCGYMFPGLLVSEDFDLENFVRKALMLTDPANRAVIELSPDLIHEVYETKQIADALVSRCHGSKALTLLRAIQNKLEKTNGELLDECMMSSARYVPYGICLVGKPGVGKSFIIGRVGAETLDDVGFKRKGNLVYTRTMGNNYWQRLRNEPIVVYDDIMALRGPFEQVQLSEIVQLLSTQPFNPPVAELEGKNKVYNPLLVMMTTNTPFPDCTALREPEAFYRRRNVMIDVDFIGDFKKFEDIPKRFVKNNGHLVFRFYDDPSNPKSGLGPKMGWFEMMTKLTKMHRVYHAQEKENYRTRYEDSIQDIASSELGSLEKLVESTTDKAKFIEGVSQLCDIPISHVQNIVPQSGIQKGWRRKERKVVISQPTTSSAPEQTSDSDSEDFVTCIHSCITNLWQYVPYSVDDCVECQEGEFIGDMGKVRPAIACDGICAIKEWTPELYPKGYSPPLRRPDKEEVKEITLNIKGLRTRAYELISKSTIKTVLGVLGAGTAILGSLYILYRMFKGTTTREVDVEAQPQSQDSVIKGIKKPVNSLRMKGALSRIKFAQHESYEETTEQSVIRLIGRNYATLSFHGGDKYYTCRCLGICGRYGIIMKHFFETWLYWGSPQMIIEIGGVSTPLILYRDNFIDLSESSIALILLPRTVPCFRDIRHHIATIDQHDYVGSRATLVNKNTTNVISTEVVNIGIISDINVNSLDGCEAQYIPDCYTYKRSGKGMCGTVLLNTVGKCNIIGIHVAGNTTGGAGYAQLIAREMFEALKAISQCDVPTTDVPSSVNHEHGVISRGMLPYELRTHGANKTRLQELPTKGEFHVVLKEPSVLSRKDPRVDGSFDPIIEGVKKQARKCLPFERELLREAYEDARDKILSTSPLMLPSHEELLTDQEIVCGIPGLSGYPGLKMHTSEGYPLVLERPKTAKAKEWLFQLEDTDNGKNLISIHQSLSEIRDHNHGLRAKGIAPASIFSSSLKDELLLREKIPIPGKTRMFNESPLELTMACKKYFGHFTAALCNAKIDNEQSVGINPMSLEWTKAALKLSETGGKCITGDYKAFGDSLDAECIYWALHIALDWYAKYFRDAPNFDEHQFIREVIIEEMLHCYRMALGCVYQTFTGIPSGFLFTAEINSIVNMIYMRIAWLSLMPPRRRSLRLFNRFTRFLFYGDDLIGGLSDEALEYFNFETLQLFLKNHDIVFTNEEKTNETFISKPLLRCRFLARGFVLHPTRPGVFLAPLEYKSIYPQLDYSWAACNDQDAALQNCRGALRDMHAHGERQYMELRQRMIDYWGQQSIYFQSDTWKYVDEDIFDD